MAADVRRPPLHIRPLPPIVGVESNERGPLVGAEIHVRGVVVRALGYDTESPAAWRIIWANAWITLDALEADR